MQGDTRAGKVRDLIGKGRPGGEQEGKGTQEDFSAMWVTVPGFMVMGLVSRLSLANHSDSGSFLVGSVLLGQDGFQRGRFWEVREDVRTGVSSLLLSFPDFFHWWWLAGSEVLPRTS